MAIYIGSNDLSASLGIPGDLSNSKLQKIIHYINEKAKEHKIPGGNTLSNLILKN